MFDVAIIGGGINGAGIARDAAMRGLSVVLLEARDFGSGTSSMSSKLIHGGLRYLEQGHVSLVKESLRERDTLLKIANSIVHPLSFLMPHCPKVRAYWKLRAGLFLYDTLFASTKLPRSRGLALDPHAFGLKSHYTKGLSYFDAEVDDARLVLLNVLDAHQHGAQVLNYHPVLRAKSEGDGWSLLVRDQQMMKEYTIRAKMIVNAAGPAVNQFLEQIVDLVPQDAVTWLKGSHIIVSGLPLMHHALTLQNTDRRIVFVIPQGNGLSLVGTTEQPYAGPLTQISVDEHERCYLLNCLNLFLKNPLNLSCIQYEFAGVRPLWGLPHSNLSAQSREYKIDQQIVKEQLILSVYGGKLTTYRAVAEKVVDQLLQFKQKWVPCLTASTYLPGAYEDDFEIIWPSLCQQYAWLPEFLLQRLLKRYGLLIHRMLAGCSRMQNLGQELAPGWYERELQYSIEYEYSKCVEDFLCRRTDGIWAQPSLLKNNALTTYF